jgi:hypothetical protein
MEHKEGNFGLTIEHKVVARHWFLLFPGTPSG